jgi:hypothetical protein
MEKNVRINPNAYISFPQVKAIISSVVTFIVAVPLYFQNILAFCFGNITLPFTVTRILFAFYKV